VLGLAILMGTVWLRLGSDQKYIQPHINAIVSFLHARLFYSTSLPVHH
jgi:hypothetical protein